MKKAIDIIKGEHRALAAVLSGLKAVVEGIGKARFAPDYELLAAMIAYVTELPERVHHPKEDGFLFVALRKRDAEIAATLDDLQAEHHAGPGRIDALKRSLDEYRRTGEPGFPAFRDAVVDYVDWQWQHMSKEESRVIPLSRRVLTPDDWNAIDTAFAANDNPWEGATGQYRALFSRIVQLAPAPIGVGPSGDERR